jgi:hypothetical protein
MQRYDSEGDNASGAFGLGFEMLIPPHPRGKIVSISKERACKKGMLEVVENKGAICVWTAHGCVSQVGRDGSGAGWSGQTQLSIAEYLLFVN